MFVRMVLVVMVMVRMMVLVMTVLVVIMMFMMFVMIVLVVVVMMICRLTVMVTACFGLCIDRSCCHLFAALNGLIGIPNFVSSVTSFSLPR